MEIPNPRCPLCDAVLDRGQCKNPRCGWNDSDLGEGIHARTCPLCKGYTMLNGFCIDFDCGYRLGDPLPRTRDTTVQKVKKSFIRTKKRKEEIERRRMIRNLAQGDMEVARRGERSRDLLVQGGKCLIEVSLLEGTAAGLQLLVRIDCSPIYQCLLDAKAPKTILLAMKIANTRTLNISVPFAFFGEEQLLSVEDFVHAVTVEASGGILALVGYMINTDIIGRIVEDRVIRARRDTPQSDELLENLPGLGDIPPWVIRFLDDLFDLLMTDFSDHVATDQTTSQPF